MALTTVPSLFGGSMMTPEQVQQQELQGMMISPAQMAQLSLPQQITATIAGAGSGIGYAGGRMMGGQTADMVRANTLNQIMQDVTSAGYTSDAEMYNALAQKLAQAGMAQDAMTARAKALEAKRTEQGMSLAERQDLRAQAAEGRAATKFTDELVNIQLRNDALRREGQTIEQQLAVAKQKAAADPTNTALQAEVQGLQTKFDDHRLKVKDEHEVAQAKITDMRQQRVIQNSQLSLQQQKLEMDKIGRDVPYPHTDPINGTKNITVGTWEQVGGKWKIKAGDGYVDTREEAYNIWVKNQKKLKDAATPPAAETKKVEPPPASNMGTFMGKSTPGVSPVTEGVFQRQREAELERQRRAAVPSYGEGM